MHVYVSIYHMNVKGKRICREHIFIEHVSFQSGLWYRKKLVWIIKIHYCDVKATIINNALTFKYLNNTKCDSLHHSNTEHDFHKILTKSMYKNTPKHIVSSQMWFDILRITAKNVKQLYLNKTPPMGFIIIIPSFNLFNSTN